MRRLLEPRGSATDSARAHWMVLSEAFDHYSNESDLIVARAQELWCENYRIARKRSRNQLSGHFTRRTSSAQAKNTMANFLRRRRAAASSAAAATDLAPAGDVARRALRGDEALQAGLKRELDHQTQRLAQRRAEAIGLGQLDVTEVSAEELEAARASNARQQKLDADNERKHRQVRTIVNPSPPNVDQVLDGMACYFADPDLRRSLPSHIRCRARCVQDAAQVDVAVAESVVLSKLPQAAVSRVLHRLLPCHARLFRGGRQAGLPEDEGSHEGRLAGAFDGHLPRGTRQHNQSPHGTVCPAGLQSESVWCCRLCKGLG